MNCTTSIKNFSLSPVIYRMVPSVVRSDAARRAVLERTLAYLLALQQAEAGNLPTSTGKRGDRLVQFCHGAPGAVLLWCRAWAVLRDDAYLRAAVQAAAVVWRHGLLRKGAGICHGVAGNGYAFLALWRCTRQPQWLHRAAQFGCALLDEHMLRYHAAHPPDRNHPLSLFEGSAGAAAFLLDLLEPDASAFPLFEIPEHVCSAPD